ncbi:MAG: apolipoprotein N-acyltransferase [Planctomycetota bacterium]
MSDTVSKVEGAPRAPWPQILLGAALLAAATPPAVVPFAEILMLPGLALWFALASGERRPVFASYWLGALHVAAFSWSLRHVTWFGWFAVMALGGCYYAAVALATQRVARRDRVFAPVLAFAAAVAGAAVLRAEMPGIGYPHGQPIHAFYLMPQLLGCVAIGGEPLGNAMLAALAAVVVQLARAWRLAMPTFARARAAFGLVALAAAAVTFLGMPVPPSETSAVVDIAAVEPGYHSLDAFDDLRGASAQAYRQRFVELVKRRLVAPTERVAGRSVDAPPDLVLWPESSVQWSVQRSVDGELSFEAMRSAFALAPNVAVLIGAAIEDEREGFTPAAVLLDADGRYLGHHEKQRLVPGGETLPFVDWLPVDLARAVREFFATNVGIPDARPGLALPPLRLPRGAGTAGEGPAFAGLICYDNAFLNVVADAVDKGAQFVAVVSNESWYRGGAEREQLVAITVLAAIATATPIVRCTTDGLTMAVASDGGILQQLPSAPAPQDDARVLRVALPLGDGRLPPITSAHRFFGWLCAAWLAFVAAHAVVPWGRFLRPSRSAPVGAAACRRDDPGGGS